MHHMVRVLVLALGLALAINLSHPVCFSIIVYFVINIYYTYVSVAVIYIQILQQFYLLASRYNVPTRPKNNLIA